MCIWIKITTFFNRFQQLRESSDSLKTTHRNHLSLYKVITSFYDYYEVLNDDAQVLEISFY